jgi:hypothetical protein
MACGAGLKGLFSGLAAPGIVFNGHCGPIMGLKFGDTVSSLLCCCACISACCAFSLLALPACPFR